MLARIPADVSKRLFTTLCAVALLTAACSEVPEGEVVAGEGTRFVPAVADFIDDVGLGNAVTVDADGVPYYSYWIFPAELAEGEIPAARPIGAPYIQTESTADEPGDFGAAVGVGSVSSDGIFTRGAAAQVRDTPTGITVPYGPATVDQLVGATSENTNGTDIAIDEQGGKHVVWTGPDGVWYAGGADSFTADQVFDYGVPIRKAGPDRASRRDGRRRRQRLGRLHGERHRPAGRGGDADRRRMGYPDGGGHPLVRRMPPAQGHGDRDHRRRSHGGLRGHLEERGDGGHPRRHEVDEHRGGHGRERRRARHGRRRRRRGPSHLLRRPGRREARHPG